MYGPLALVGGDEFHPGNEHQDEILRDACAGRPAYVVATAAQDFASGAVEAARGWFAGLGLEVRELRIRTKEDARSPEIVAAAAGAGTRLHRGRRSRLGRRGSPLEPRLEGDRRCLACRRRTCGLVGRRDGAVRVVPGPDQLAG